MAHSYDPFEHRAAQFIARAIRYVPETWRVLIFASPLCARNSDVCLLWHPRYRRKYRGKIIVGLIFSLIFGCGKGIIRLVSRMPWRYVVYGDVQDTLLVVPDACGHVNEDGQYRTSYVQTEEQDALFVFGQNKYSKGHTKDIPVLSVKKQVHFAVGLTKAGIRAFFDIEGSIGDRILLLLLWSAWGLSLQWLQEYYLASALSAIMKKYHLAKIGCVHEMHTHARVVWSVAEQYNVKRYTIQHAAFSSGKRWYICYPEELESGLQLPDFIYVYDQRTLDDLKGVYADTKFALGCSARYAHWKDVLPKMCKGTAYLFVGALARFDNEVLVATLHSLLKSAHNDITVRLRLHPFVQMSYRSRRWIRQQAQRGGVELSAHAPIEDDLREAAVVIGMSTTVLQEAILIGTPVIQLFHSDYLQYIDLDDIAGVLKRDYSILCMNDISEASRLSVDSHIMRERMGLYNPVITYKRLFALLES